MHGRLSFDREKEKTYYKKEEKTHSAVLLGCIVYLDLIVGDPLPSSSLSATLDFP